MITVHKAGISLKQLRAIEPTTPKNAGRRWKPIRHGDLIDSIKDQITTRGWRITQALFSTAREGADMAGAFLMDDVRGVETVPGTTLALGFLNSNARRKALQITVGASITCCTNGMCTGSILLNRVHDHTVDLPAELNVALNKYTEAAKEIPGIIRNLKERELSPDEASGILLRAGRLRLVGWTAIGRVDKEYHWPTFTDHGNNTSWALLNAFTFAARRNIAPTRQMETYNTFRALLPTAN